jgi:hypothetical protein
MPLSANFQANRIQATFRFCPSMSDPSQYPVGAQIRYERLQGETSLFLINSLSYLKHPFYPYTPTLPPLPSLLAEQQSLGSSPKEWQLQHQQ